MFPAFGGSGWWPLNSEVALLRTSPERLAQELNPLGRARTVWFAGLTEAVAGCGPYRYLASDTLFLVRAADDRTVVLSSRVPDGGLLHGYAHDAAVIGCELVCAQWQPASRGRLASAGFDHRLPGSEGPAPGPRKTNQLSLQVSDQYERWAWTRIPPGPQHRQRGYEEPDAYRARRVSDRLPLELIGRYLRAVGIPIDDPGYLTGPVLAVLPPKPVPAEHPKRVPAEHPKPVPAEHTWSTVAELRAISGYPPDGIPTDLRRAPTLTG